MENKKLVMFMSGMLNLIGEFVSKDGETITVKNPMSVMFNIVEKKLQFEAIPIIFNACIKHGENIWTFKADSILNQDVEFNQEIHDIYNNMIVYTSPANVSKSEVTDDVPEFTIPQ